MAGDLVPLFYVSGIAGSVSAVVLGARSWAARQRRQWADEGAAAQKNTDALDANTRAAAANWAPRWC